MTTAPTPPALAIADLLEYLDGGGLHFGAQSLPDAAAAELRRLHADNERLRAEQAQAMIEASSLAMSLFRKHYSSDPDYASGAVKFGLCDELRGVISQIDNMSTGLARAELEARKPLPVSVERLRVLAEAAEGSGQCVCVNPRDVLGLLDTMTTMARAVHALQVINHEQRKLLDSTICGQRPTSADEWLRVSRVIEQAQAAIARKTS